jgi:hypothetical protein
MKQKGSFLSPQQIGRTMHGFEPARLVPACCFMKRSSGNDQKISPLRIAMAPTSLSYAPWMRISFWRA